MSIQAGVASKYQVEFESTYDVDDFERMLDELEDKYPDVVAWRDDNRNMIELSRFELEQAKGDKELSDELRKFAEDLLNDSDPDYDNVHIEMLEIF